MLIFNCQLPQNVKNIWLLMHKRVCLDSIGFLLVCHSIRKSFKVVEGLSPGAISIHDDILLFGEGKTMEETQANHDENLHRLMQRCRDQNVRLNLDKVCLRRSEVLFIGHVLTSKGVKPDPAKIRAVLDA